MRLRAWFEGALALGAALAIIGGATLATLHLVNPSIPYIPRIEEGYRHLMFGFFFLTMFSVAAVLVGALGRATPPPPRKDPPAIPATEIPAAEEPVVPKTDLQKLYREMKTFVELETWELALAKADQILREHPGTREAERVESNINELRWKAEPKFISEGNLSTVDRERKLRQKGLAQMLQHVRTYVDLEMWDLARQKSLLVIKNFPDTPEAEELTRLFPKIEEKIRTAVPAEKPEA